MKIFICQVCGDAHIGRERPADCPFCGAPGNFMKTSDEASLLFDPSKEIGDVSRKNLEFSLDLEKNAAAIYACMAEKSSSMPVKKMYQRLSKVEAEHAKTFALFLGSDKPEIGAAPCPDSDIDNFKQTLQLEKDATDFYVRFAKEAPEQHIKILFTAIAQAERGHIELMEDRLG